MVIGKHNNFHTGTMILDDENCDESEPDFEAKVFLSAICGGNSVASKDRQDHISNHRGRHLLPKN